MASALTPRPRADLPRSSDGEPSATRSCRRMALTAIVHRPRDHGAAARPRLRVTVHRTPTLDESPRTRPARRSPRRGAGRARRATRRSRPMTVADGRCWRSLVAGGRARGCSTAAARGSAGWRSRRSRPTSPLLAGAADVAVATARPRPDRRLAAGVGITLRADALGVAVRAALARRAARRAGLRGARRRARARCFPALVALPRRRADGLFLTGDVFNFYVFFELSMIARLRRWRRYGGERRAARRRARSSRWSTCSARSCSCSRSPASTT